MEKGVFQRTPGLFRRKIYLTSDIDTSTTLEYNVISKHNASDICFYVLGKSIEQSPVSIRSVLEWWLRMFNQRREQLQGHIPPLPLAACEPPLQKEQEEPPNDELSTTPGLSIKIGADAIQADASAQYLIGRISRMYQKSIVVYNKRLFQSQESPDILYNTSCERVLSAINACFTLQPTFADMQRELFTFWAGLMTSRSDVLFRSKIGRVAVAGDQLSERVRKSLLRHNQQTEFPFFPINIERLLKLRERNPFENSLVIDDQLAPPPKQSDPVAYVIKTVQSSLQEFFARLLQQMLVTNWRLGELHRFQMISAQGLDVLNWYGLQREDLMKATSPQLGYKLNALGWTLPEDEFLTSLSSVAEVGGDRGILQATRVAVVSLPVVRIGQGKEGKKWKTRNINCLAESPQILTKIHCRPQMIRLQASLPQLQTDETLISTCPQSNLGYATNSTNKLLLQTDSFSQCWKSNSKVWQCPHSMAAVAKNSLMSEKCVVKGLSRTSSCIDSKLLSSGIHPTWLFRKLNQTHSVFLTLEQEILVTCDEQYRHIKPPASVVISHCRGCYVQVYGLDSPQYLIDAGDVCSERDLAAPGLLVSIF